VGVAQHEQRVAGAAEPAAEEAGLGRPAAALGRDVRHGHERDDGGLRRPAQADDRADGGGGGGAGGAARLPPGGARGGGGGRGGGGVRVVDAVVDGADQGTAVHLPGEARQVLAQLHAGDRGGDGAEFAADLGRGGGLHIPHVQVAGPTIKEHQDAGVRASGRPG